MIGLHGQYQFDNGIFIRALSQVGGFGVGSDLTWDVFGGLGYQFNNSISATAGYRHLEVDYENNGFVFDVELSGPVIGMTITFCVLEVKMPGNRKFRSERNNRR